MLGAHGLGGGPLISKAELRQHCRAARRALTAEQRAAASARAAEHLIASGLLDRVSSIALYAAYASEADPGALEVVARSFYPRVDGSALTFHACLRSALVPGFKGLREPAADLPRSDLADIDVVIVPGLAFDARGHRLGAGMGFYDRALEQARASGGGVCAIGFALSAQLIDAVPREDHDQPMDVIVTDTGIRYSPAR